MSGIFDSFARRHHFSSSDRSALDDLYIRTVDMPADTRLATLGERAQYSIIVLSGFLGRSKMTRRGQEQIVNIYVVGDIPDLSSLFLPVADADLTTIGPASVGLIPRRELIDLLPLHPTIIAAFWQEMAVDLSVTREWLLNVGQRSAEERMAHFFLEMQDRLRYASGSKSVIALPLTQSHIASVLGVSSVHVNRVLQHLRELGLIRLSRRALEICDEPALAALAGYDRAYLHQNEELGGRH